MNVEDVTRLLGEPSEVVEHRGGATSIHYPRWTVVLDGVVGDGFSLRRLSLDDLEAISKILVR